jgi:hypothetical protein
VQSGEWRWGCGGTIAFTNLVTGFHSYQDLATGQAKSDTTHAQSFDVACARDRFSVARSWKPTVAVCTGGGGGQKRGSLCGKRTPYIQEA